MGERFPSIDSFCCPIKHFDFIRSCLQSIHAQKLCKLPAIHRLNWKEHNNDHQLLNSVLQLLNFYAMQFPFYRLFMLQLIIQFTFYQQFQCKTGGGRKNRCWNGLCFWSSVEYLIIISLFSRRSCCESSIMV